MIYYLIFLNIEKKYNLYEFFKDYREVEFGNMFSLFSEVLDESKVNEGTPEVF